MGSGPGRRRRRWFRVIALASPLLVFILLEFLLRLLGWGYPVRFFLKARVHGRDVWIGNEQFSRRYFPPGLERTPQPLMFPVTKPPGTLRVFVLGESAAMGDPEPAFGFPRILETLLREAFPGNRIEVINTAVTAINSHVIREIAKDCAGKQGDFWIVYMGHNEVVGPFGAGTIFGGQTPPLPVIRAGLWLKSTRVGQSLDWLRWKFTPGSGRPAAWDGMAMFFEQQVSAGDPRLTRLYEHFETNLGDIIRWGTDSGARVVVSSVVANLKDCPPFASRHRPDWTVREAADWEKALQAGIASDRAGNFAAALSNYQQAATMDARHAELWFRMGRVQLSRGDAAGAGLSLRRALEQDTLRFRADARVQQAIQTATAREPRARFVDAVELVAQRSAQGLPGGEFLHEHVHFNFAGNYLMARAFAEEIRGGATHGPPLLAEEECARRLAFTDFDRYRVLDEVRERMQRPPFAQQWNHEERDRLLKKELERTGKASLLAAFQMYEEAIARSPEDWVLRENFATLLQDFNEPIRAGAEWRKVVELLPLYAEGHFMYGLILASRGRRSDAAAQFRETLRLEPRHERAGKLLEEMQAKKFR